MPRKRTSEKGALELLEQAVHLLRLAPLPVLLCYYIGAFPFVLGFLFFWADMSRSAFAPEHCGRAAFGLVLLFIWMKTWQAIFATELTARITGTPAGRWSLRRGLRIAHSQIILQPSGLFLLPISFVVLIPFGWAFAFYQNTTVLAGDGDAKSLFKRAVRQSAIFPQQNHVALLVLFAFALFVWMNMTSLIVFLPGLLKTFLGIETVFTRAGNLAFFNTTFFAASVALTYLAVDPLVKSLYALRCFYGQSITTGDDLKVELGSATKMAAAMIVMAICYFAAPQIASAQTAASQNSPAPQQPPPVPAPELERSIEKVLNRPEFTWRSPREKIKIPEAKKGWFVLFLESIFDTLKSWMRSLRDVLRDILDWLGKIFRKKPSDAGRGSRGDGWMVGLQLLVFVLLALIAAALALLLFRMWKRRARTEVVMAEPVLATPDLTDENVAANELPEDGWLKLARELMEKGDLRLALRALYLASLAHLAQREFVNIAKFKSNREYELELRRRARALPELQNAFGQNVTIFDRIWYGMHEVNQESLQNFQSNMERIRAC